MNHRRGGLLLAIMLLSGCPQLHVEHKYTKNVNELPQTVPELVSWADEVYVKANATPDGSSAEMQTALLALEKARTLDPKSYEVAWKAARACAWLADELYDDKNQRAYYSNEGIDHAKAAIALEPKKVEGHYYSGINLGLQATTKVVGAKFMVPSVRDAWKRAMAIDASYDHGGPPRTLGSLYAEAPPWPASIGDPDKGVELLQQALKYGPDYPLNNLRLGVALVKAEKPDQARGQFRVVLDAQPRPDDAHFLVKWKSLAKKYVEEMDKGQQPSPPQ